MYQSNEKPDICSACGGQCCKHGPGAYHWKDLGHTEAQIRATAEALIGAGLAQIDWWEARTPQYYLRPAVKAEQGANYRVFSPSWGGECVYLTPTGCLLSYKARPRACRRLTPEPGMKCHTNYDKAQAKNAWRQYA